MSSRRYAVIDCGTNTFNLLVAECEQEHLRMLCRQKRVVKLGSQGLSKGILSERGKTRALAAIKSYLQKAEDFKAEKIIAVGTSALRDAIDGPAFLQKVKKETGLSISLIDGRREAELIYEGVKAGVELDDRRVLVIDIGGGSTEFILCNRHRIFWKMSYRLGAARLKEQFPFSDPAKKAELSALDTFLSHKLSTLFMACKRHPPAALIGSSGSFDSFAAMILSEKGEQRLRTSHYRFSLSDYRRLHKKLINTTYLERLKIPGMLAMRADMIVQASALVTFVLRKTGLKNMQLSTYSLKEGLLVSVARGDKI
jgi:exopolyphosphatase/guanosine-5'-triphosphate,3'-diphosphate pyrophosphatase